MTKDRLTGNALARLRQFYIDRGYAPDVAAQKASADMSFRKMQDVRAAAPAPQIDEFRETPPAPGEVERSMPSQTATVPAQPVAQTGNPADNEERRLNEMRVLNDQARAQGMEEPYPNLPAPRPVDRSAYAQSLNQTLTQSLGLPASTQSPPWPNANPPAPAPAAPAPAPAATQQEEGEPGFTGRTGDILQRALDASRAATATQTPSVPAATPAKTPAAPVRQNQTNIPAMPVRRPDAIGQLPGAQPAQQESLLSRIFSAPKDPYAGMSSRQLMDIANRDPDNAAAFFRADQALRKEQPDMFKPQTEKRGGSVGGGKDAALHKALEIIHHMLTRGR
jgi:hypothetical protein